MKEASRRVNTATLSVCAVWVRENLEMRKKKGGRCWGGGVWMKLFSSWDQGPRRLKKNNNKKIQDMQVDKVQTLRIAKLGSCAVCQASLAGFRSDIKAQEGPVPELEIQWRSSALILHTPISVKLNVGSQQRRSTKRAVRSPALAQVSQLSGLRFQIREVLINCQRTTIMASVDPSMSPEPT